MNRLVYALPVVLFAAIGLVFVLGLGRDPSSLPSTLIDQPLPSFSLPPVIAGHPGLRSRDFRGRPRLLNVFASWCVSCRIEHPVLLELKSAGILIEGLDWKDAASAGAQYLRENGDPYATAGNDQVGTTGIDLGVSGVPETFVVDGAGRVRFKQVGPITPEDWKKTIEPLMLRLSAS
ncbi:MAG: DsbE family thiol:disulfide interchange protein [Alphaproteobacteria bacterium]|nr:DsbE family thiol:disulfide interchange protein [Alphaproteobacteria bacterium]